MKVHLLAALLLAPLAALHAVQWTHLTPLDLRIFTLPRYIRSYSAVMESICPSAFIQSPD